MCNCYWVMFTGCLHCYWEMLEANILSEEFLDLVNDCYLTQHVNTPTRDSNVLDLFFSSEDGMVENLHVKEHLEHFT